MLRNLLVAHDLLEAANQPESLHWIYAEFLFAELKRYPELTAYVMPETLDYLLSRASNLSRDLTNPSSSNAATVWLTQLAQVLRLPPNYRYRQSSFVWGELEALELQFANARELTVVCFNPSRYRQANHPENTSSIVTVSQFLNQWATAVQLQQILQATESTQLPSEPASQSAGQPASQSASSSEPSPESLSLESNSAEPSPSVPALLSFLSPAFSASLRPGAESVYLLALWLSQLLLIDLLVTRLGQMEPAPAQQITAPVMPLPVSLDLSLRVLANRDGQLTAGSFLSANQPTRPLVDPIQAPIRALIQAWVRYQRFGLAARNLDRLNLDLRVSVSRGADRLASVRLNSLQAAPLRIISPFQAANLADFIALPVFSPASAALLYLPETLLPIDLPPVGQMLSEQLLDQPSDRLPDQPPDQSPDQLPVAHPAQTTDSAQSRLEMPITNVIPNTAPNAQPDITRPGLPPIEPEALALILPAGHSTLALPIGQYVISNFDGVGRGVAPSLAVDQIDRLQLLDSHLIASSMLLEQQGSDLVIKFESEAALTITLQNFSLENLDNLSVSTSAAVTVGNLLFANETAIQDQFDVINSDQVLGQVLRPNIVTFLNGLDNVTQGYENSDDIIDGQAGDDSLAGLSGNDKLRGGQGNDALWGGTGDDILSGGTGLNQLSGDSGSDQFVLSQLGSAIIQDFAVAEDWLSWENHWENQAALGQFSAQLSGSNTLLLYAGQTVGTLLNVQVTDIALLTRSII